MAKQLAASLLRVNAIDLQTEARFQRGFPHVRELVDGPPDERTALGLAEKAFFGRRDFTVEWPRDVASRFLRAMTKGSAAACQTAGPLTEAEARALITAMIAPENRSREYLVESALFLLEAMQGSEWTLEAVLEGFEAMPQAALETKNLHGPIFVAWWSGMILKRVPLTVAAKARARMQAIVDRGLNPVSHRFAFVLGGESALVASGHAITPFNLLYCADQAFMAKHARFPGFVTLDPYLGWLGGDPVLEVYVELAKKLDREWATQAIEGLALLASPLAVRVLEELQKKKTLAAKVSAALAARGSPLTPPPATPKRKPTRKK